METAYESIIEKCNQINDQVENDDHISHREKLEKLETLLEMLEPIDDDYSKARTKINYAYELLLIGDISKAHDLGLKAMHLSRGFEDVSLDLKIFNILGRVHSQVGRYALALDYYHQALRLTDDVNQKLNYKSIIFNNIAIIYSDMGMKEKAIDYYKEAFELALKEYNIKARYLVAYNIIDMLLDLNRLDEVPYYIEIMKECLNTKRDLKGLYHIVLSKYLRMLSLNSEAENELNIAEVLFEKDQDAAGLNDVKFERVKQLSQNKMHREAFELCQSVVETSEKIEDHEILREALKTSCELAEILELTKEGFESYRKLVEYDEQLMHNIYEASIFQLSEKTEVELVQKIHENNERLFENMRFIHEVSKDISKEQDYDALIKLIIQKLISFISCDAIVIALYDEPNGLITRRTMYHDNEITFSYDIEVSNKSSLAAWTIRNKKEVYTNFYSQLKLNDFESLDVNFPEIVVPYESVFYVPLINDKEVIGVFSLQKYERNGFNHYELEMIRVFSSYISIAITNALKSEQMHVMNKTLEEISRRDGLSELLNRNALNEDIIKILNHALINQTHIATILCDIDFFKEYNDKYGHLDGDVALKKISQIIQNEAVQFTPYIYRFGGDEFLIILKETNYSEIKALTGGILSGVKQLGIPNKDVGVDNVITVSVGAALFENYNPMLDEDLLLKSADNALYASKRIGRNQAHIIKF